MKKSLYNRFEIALQLVQEALAAPVDFQALDLTFGAGSRQLAGKIIPADADSTTFRYQLPGRSGVGDANEIAGLLKDNCQLYDTCRIELRQRGQQRFFTADERGVRMGNLESARQQAEPESAEGISATRNYLIKTNEAADLLQAIDIIDKQGRLRNDKIRKYHQIDRFIELADPLLRELCANTSELSVIDLACGKSYLSFVLNYYIREKLGHPCRFTGIDLAPGVVASSQQLATSLGYRNMRFMQADLRDFKPEGPVDLCISLHACDTATDLALAAAIAAGSRAIIVVPCCQRELLASSFRLPSLAENLMQNGVLKARLADLLTDALRLLLLQAAGYEASLTEYISPLDTPKNLMIRAKYTGKRQVQAIAEYRRLTGELGQTITLGKILEENDYGRRTGNR